MKSLVSEDRKTEVPQLTVIVPCYNPDFHLFGEMINSLRTQSEPLSSFNVLVVDDGSDDTSFANILEKEAHLNVAMIRHDSNQGLNAARQTGVRHAETEWVMFLDSDDLLTSDAIEVMLLEASKRNVDAVFGGVFRLEESSGSAVHLPISSKDFEAGEKRLAKLFSGDLSFTMCGRMFRKHLLDDQVFEMPERIPHEDCVSIPRIALQANEVVVLKNATYFYRQSRNSITTTTSIEHLDALAFIADSWIDLVHRYKLNGRRLFPKIRLGIEKLFFTIYSRLDDSVIGQDRIAESCEKLNQILHEIEVVEDGYDILQLAVNTEKNLSNSLNKRFFHQTSFFLKDKVVLLAFADYQVMSCLHLGRGLRDAGIPVTIVDFSPYLAGGSRRFRHSETSRLLAARIEMVERQSKFQPGDLLMARLVIAMNDFNPLVRDAFEARRAFGLPTLAFIEGINDFDRVDGASGSLRPYRRSTHRALAGKADLEFFTNFENEVVGLPLIAEAVDQDHSVLERTGQKVVLNVNFTYGVLEDKRDEFTSAVIEVCSELSIDLVITRHPMDSGVIGAGLDSTKSQSELLREDCIFVSRFGTGILEALAVGTPVIYFNPHGEQVEKFKDPLGAYEVAETPEQLRLAIRQVQEKIASRFDFYAAAKQFLQLHASVDTSCSTNLLSVRQKTVGLVQRLTDDARSHSAELHHQWLLKDIEMENA